MPDWDGKMPDRGGKMYCFGNCSMTLYMIIASYPVSFTKSEWQLQAKQETSLSCKRARASSKRNKKQWWITIARQSKNGLLSWNKRRMTIARQRTIKLLSRNERRITIVRQKTRKLQSQDKRQTAIFAGKTTSKLQSQIERKQQREQESWNKSIKRIPMSNDQGNKTLESNQTREWMWMSCRPVLVPFLLCPPKGTLWGAVKA